MENLTALGFCPRCKEQLIDVNGQKKCFNCGPSVRPAHLGPKPKPAVEVPETKEASRLIGEKNQGPKVEHRAVTKSGTAKDALDIMKHLPIPETEKEFKQIKKIIKQLEQLVGE